MKDFSEVLNDLKVHLGLNQIASGPMGTPITIEFYEKWLAKNFNGEMNYLNEHLPLKKSPQLLNQNLKSVITVSQSYFPATNPLSNTIPARTALYAQNSDYHFWLKDKLLVIISELQKSFPNETFFPFVDSGPVLERNWAYENGLGWFGKNTCLIHPKFGSLFFIAEILSTIPHSGETLAPLPDFCGTCRKCIDICPTGAIVEPHVLKSDLCISYLTIEAKTNPPVELRSKIGDWFFGCDLCQTTCPWNEKVFRSLKLPETSSTDTSAQLTKTKMEDQELTAFFRGLLKSSNNQIAKDFYGTPLVRAGGNGLKRNALIVIANRKLVDLKKDVEDCVQHPKLSELATWCLAQLN